MSNSGFKYLTIQQGTIMDEGVVFFSQKAAVVITGAGNLPLRSRDKSIMIQFTGDMTLETVISKENYTIAEATAGTAPVGQTTPLHVNSLQTRDRRVRGALLQMPELRRGVEYEVSYNVMDTNSTVVSGKSRFVAV